MKTGFFAGSLIDSGIGLALSQTEAREELIEVVEHFAFGKAIEV